MAYYFYLGNVLLPVAPKKLDIKISNKNKTYDLMNYSEINVLKKAGLTSIEFEILLPNVKYPFAIYKNGFQNAKYYLDLLERLKTNRSAFQFIVIRRFPDNKSIYNTNIKVSLEEYTITDSTDEGFDVKVKIKLKQYQDYSAKQFKVNENRYRSIGKMRLITVNNTEKINIDTSGQNYIVKAGDTLWDIAQKLYGNGSKYIDIYSANKDRIKNPNLLHSGQILWIPE